MGGSGSKPAEDGPSDTPGIVMTPEMQKVLDENTYVPGANARYPYFLVQLTENEELPFGENLLLVSDSIAAYVSNNPVTHIIAQTHGWNTPPDKAIAVPFTEFMGGMQNDRAMPSEDDDDFHPIFIAFIWPALPLEFAKADDALTRAELLKQHEDENVGEDSDISRAAAAAKKALENEDPDDAELADSMRILVEDSLDDDDEDDEDVDLKAVRNGEPDAVVQRAKDTPTGQIIEGVLSFFRPVMRPFENLVFGRLMKRGRRVGVVMAAVLGKVMEACRDRVKLCMMANSLGAHVLVGVMGHVQSQLPYKPHTIFFVQGAIANQWFRPGGRFESIVGNVAGPVACTYSSRDLMLKNIFGPFHGDALGFDGSQCGNEVLMKSLDEIRESPYTFDYGLWNDVNASDFIDEGNPVAGGHGDFKEDETTSLYWNLIKSEVDPSLYDF